MVGLFTRNLIFLEDLSNTDSYTFGFDSELSELVVFTSTLYDVINSFDNFLQSFDDFPHLMKQALLPLLS